MSESKENNHCHVCGQLHSLARTPWPFVPTGKPNEYYCPYDTRGKAKVLCSVLYVIDNESEIPLTIKRASP